MEKFYVLLKAIFFIVTSVALVLFGYLISGGTNNPISTILFAVGAMLCFVGILFGVSNLSSDEGEKK